MIQPPEFTWARRLAWGLAGILWFFWIAYEDQGLVVITIVAVVFTFAGGLTVIHRWMGRRALPRRKWIINSTMIGLVGGAAVGPTTALLMLVKLGLHAHPEADFGPEQFVQALSRTIYWAILGTFIGAALGFLVPEKQT